jgi:hypothetical protein
MTNHAFDEIMAACQWQRLTCPCCGAAECLTAREVAFYPLALPREAGHVRLDVQLRCRACDQLVRLRVYEHVDGMAVRLHLDDPHGDAAALGLADG